MNVPSLLEARSVGFSYDGTVQVLRGVDLHVDEGEIVGLIGPNGSGKSTLIKLVFDLLHLKSGTLLLSGHHCQSALARPEAQYLASNDHLPEFLRAREYLTIIGDLYGRSLDVGAARSFFEEYGMAGRLEDLIEDFSHGMRKKTQLISAILQRRPLTIIDETVNGIDLEAQYLAEQEFVKMRSEGRSILLCTHDFSMLERVADRVLFLDHGVVVADAPVRDVVASHRGISQMVFDHLDDRRQR
ncbi:ABC-2 type transport system ATP-binding protein [Tessaracoccus bendigoensis DSM 12906]|uniref:ABC-2 type transport system ATP-binding protein n=1 Tax=Tessaracoccus bendigoensis DSM 12906 TaxID=1123357 RepID=A0A1M6N909_9ACTN|nr:ABC transporter ATP-binding protein [Tessaracoccus bendigoensis]SHJ92230.1 ABC-2 type transport system ATP-binding protein [Tessaracoccus bendigoensis DSM 12906]